MSDHVRRESPLVQFLSGKRGVSAPGDAGVRLGERPFLGHINLRGDPADAAFLQAVEGVLGAGLPLAPNTVVESGDLAALWLGPDEWLLITPPDRETTTADALKSALGDLHAAVTDVTGGQTVISVSGPHARDVLAKGCPLDLHPRVFGPGRCAQSHIAGVNALIRQRDGSPSYDIVVRRSFADYLARWLEDAAAEYGLAVESG